ncbi:MAG: pentapeptide MXKDX repeat protein [Pseudomonadota bacterium]|nr:pentapeptide MXKDX repeat protein [Pseudomonadota bacterium]
MTKLTTTLFAACLIAAGSTAFAQDGMKKDGAMMHKDMTMEQCKDHMDMQKKDMKKDAASMAMDKECGAMMKDHMKGGDMMKKDDGMMKKDGMKK